VKRAASREQLQPGHFLSRVRLAEAERRLRETDEPVTAIALDVGFVSPQHFSTHFRRARGLSPSAWRARQRSR
jgi:AraC-like DNA-binding protein